MATIIKQADQTSLTEPTRIVVDIYCRLQSSAEEDFSEQETACRQVAEAHGFTIGMVHRDRGSGMDSERPGLALLRTRYTSGAIRGVIVKNLERLSRSMPQLIVLMQEMDAHGVSLYCADEGLTETTNGKIIREIVSLATEVEAEKRKSRRKKALGTSLTEGHR